MLTLIPKSWYSWDFRVLENGREIAFIDRHWFQEKASFRIHGKPFDVRRTSVIHGTFVLEHAGVMIAEAEKPSSLRRAFEITAGPERYRLQATSAFRRQFDLLQSDTLVGTIRPESILGRTALAQFPEKMPLEIQLFMAFLVLILWKRASGGSS